MSTSNERSSDQPDVSPIVNPQGSPDSRPLSPVPSSHTRATTTARLASPIPSYGGAGTRSPGRSRRAGQSIDGTYADITTPLAGSSNSRPTNVGPGASALASALSASMNRSPSRSGADARSFSEDVAHVRTGSNTLRSNYGSFSNRAIPGEIVRQPTPTEDFDVIRQYLAGPASFDASKGGSGPLQNADNRAAQHSNDLGGEIALVPSLEGNFSSLQMQGGDITREIYRRTEAEAVAKQTRLQRSQSFHDLAARPVNGELDIENIKKPGGFRRDHLRRVAPSPAHTPVGVLTPPGIVRQPSYLTSNFFEFLTLYGHFAGESHEDDEVDEDSSVPRETSRGLDEGDDEDGRPPGETSALLGRGLRRRQTYTKSGLKKGAAGTVLILLKSFVGTGVLFLPRAFLNGGMLFSTIVLIGIAFVSNYCFILLTKSRLAWGGSFADMGQHAHGRTLRFLINASLVLSQVGFASAYIVFTSENLQAFILAVSNCRTYIDIKWMVLMQMVVFLPASLWRNLSKLAIIVYIADALIVLGLVYLYYSDVATIVDRRGISDVKLFNRHDWTVFIGTAIFTFEGIGLIIPIQDGMKKPEQLPGILAGVMILITVIFTSMGALSYAAFGSKTKTVIISNLPQDNKFVNAVQFMYSLAILLSTPLQIYPAITIMEKGLFTKSGKFSKGIKWQKNLFRFLVVVVCAMIAWVGANDLDKFVALVGSFACIPLVYIYPPLIHRKAVATRGWTVLLDYALCFFGIALMGYTSVLTIHSWVSGPVQKVPRGYCDHR